MAETRKQQDANGLVAAGYWYSIAQLVAQYTGVTHIFVPRQDNTHAFASHGLSPHSIPS